MVGTGCRLGTTADAFELTDDILHFLSCDESADALQIAIAASNEGDVLNDIVVVDGDGYVF